MAGHVEDVRSWDLLDQIFYFWRSENIVYNSGGGRRHDISHEPHLILSIGDMW